jgi:acetolactate synthase I/II/III large subunit
MKETKAISQMTGGEAMVASLATHGLNTMFGLPGIQSDWLFNALYDARGKVRVIHTRHEQGAGYMALGYALASGEIGVCSVVPGPGVLNASAALATAAAVNAPVFFLAGQIPSHLIGRQLGTLHEIPDQLALLRTLCKWATRAESPAEIPTLVAQAVQQLRSGRPQPVALELPMDVLADRSCVDTSPLLFEPYQPPVDMDRIEDAARALGGAKNPLIFVGGGAQGASTEVTRLAEALQAPVVAYRMGRGIVDSRNYLSLVLPAARKVWDSADVVLALGTNLRTPLMSWGSRSDRKLIRIEVDGAVMAQIAKPDISVIARVEDALPVLLERLAQYNPHRSAREEELLAIRADWDRRASVLEPQISFLKVIRDVMGEEGIFVDELTQVGFASRIVMPVYRPRTFISTGYMGTLGYGFPTAIGVKVAKPKVPVVSVTGDGGFLFAMPELATAVQHGIALVTVLFNNNQYGNVQQMQRDVYGGKIIATDLVNPDFGQLVTSFGAKAYRAATPVELQHILERALANESPTVIEVPVGDMPSVDRFR